MLSQSDCYLSASGLKNAALQVLDHDFEFIVGDKKYPCNSFFAEFLSPAVAEIRNKDKTVNSFKIDIEDPNNYFDLVIQLMNGSEIEADVNQSVFLSKVGKILKNDEIADAFSFVNNTNLTIRNVVPTFLEKQKLNRDVSKELEYITKHFFSLDQNELMLIDKDSLVKVISNENLLIDSEDSLYSFVTEIIDKKGPEYKQLLNYIRYESISDKYAQSFNKYITPETIQNEPMLWQALQKRLLLPSDRIRIPDRYVHKDIPIHYKNEPFNGIFSFITKLLGGKNPVEADAIEVTVNKDECNISPSSLMNYKSPPSRWYLAEHENNWVCFDFKNAKISMTAYTISSGSDSSYWEYPVSYTWEGSEDKKKWFDIDVQDQNTDMGGNEKTHTWVLKKPTKFFRYVRFRLRNVTRRGGLYTPRMELFGFYEPPEELKDACNKIVKTPEAST